MSNLKMGKALRSLESFRFKVPLLFIFALSVRLVLVFSGPPLKDFMYSDMKGYIGIADDVLNNIWKINHFFQSIGYPLFIGSLKSVFTDWMFALNVVQGLLSFCTLIPLYFITLHRFGKKTALISLFIASVHVPWVLFNNLALPETIFTFFLSMSAWFSFKLVTDEKSSKVSAFGWAFFFMLGFWLKGTHVFWAPLFLLSLFVWKKKSAIPALSVMVITLGVGLTLHGLLTYEKIGKFQISASAGGLNFVEGKCPDKNNYDNAGYSWHSPLFYQLGLRSKKHWDRPFTDSAHFINQGLNCIERDPLVLIQSLESIPLLFVGNFTWPLNQMRWSSTIRLYELFFSLFLVMGLFLSLRTLILRRQFEDLIIWGIPVLAIFMCVYVFKSEIRFRIPYDFWLIPMAVYGLREKYSL